MARILVIEDDASIRGSLCRLLRLQGHEAAEAENGLLGVAVAQRNRPDLILCDVLMPELDGFGVLAAIRADSSTARTPFIFLTASADPDDKRLGIEQGADAYITKPFQAERLAAVISELLTRRR